MEDQHHSAPFVERRRRSSIHDSWPAALDCLQRHLMGFQVANEQLKASEEKFRAIFENAPIGMFEMGPEGHLLMLNPAMARILGYESPDDALGERSKGSEIKLVDPGEWEKCAERRDHGCGVDLQIVRKGGEARWVRFNLRRMSDHGRVAGYKGTAEDITDHKEVQIRTELLAYCDVLTGLPNRTLFYERFAEVLTEADRRGARGALFLIEFDRFKIINDSLGDQFGDRLLQEIASRIRNGAGKSSIVARISGAEFAIILPDVKEDKFIAGHAEAILAQLAPEYSFLGHSLNVSCNMGIGLFPEHGRECETLVKRAEVAMCCAASDGSNNFRIFTNELNEQIQVRLRLENGLRHALSRKELFLEYQPQVDIRTGAVTGLEALLRWNHHELGLIPPTQFIGVAESSGLIVPIGEWVLHRACQQARSWENSGLGSASIAVNVSAVQFRQQGFCDLVRRILQDTGLSPDRLELELTESLLLTNADVISTIITELRAMGVMVAIDDFGTGYSSLGYLKQFKVNRLKIARSFVQDVSIDADDAAITTAIIRMAKAMNLAVLAEGVETEEQLLFLRAQQCYTIQGFYFSRPAAVRQIDEYLRTGFGHVISTTHREAFG